MKPKIIAVVGPTASGKSELAVRLARKFNGEVISADSRQIYKGLNIATGKITTKEMRGVIHHCLDIANPKKQFSVSKYKKHAVKALQYTVAKNKTPIVCGGTGLYIDALLRGIEFPEVAPNIKLRRRLEKLSNTDLCRKLKKLDSRRAREIDKNNPRRLIRAIEIATALGRVPKLGKIVSECDVLWIGIKPKDTELKKKIHSRLISRVKNGMLAEAKSLNKNGMSFKRMNELGLEYKYLAQLLQHKISKEHFFWELEKEIWKYSKRQMTWFKRYKDIIWFESTSRSNLAKIEKSVKNFI